MIEREEFSSMFEQNPIAQTVIDKDFNFILFNEPFVRMIGFTRDRLMSIKFSDLRAKNMIKYVKDSGESVADAIRLRRVTAGESTFDTPSGLHIVIRTNIPLYDEKGEVRYVYVTYNEVTKIVQAQEFCEMRVIEASESCGVISKNVEGLSGNAAKASEGMTQIAQAMQDMSAAVQEITASMESVSGISRETNELSQNGAMLASKAEKSMEEIAKSSDKVYTIVADVEKQMGEISKIVVLIRDLANQTNLLALNAAIEAARAGDAGRGFAVVATEVKSLAQESRNSAERIEEMISTLKKSTQNASVAMGDAKNTVTQGEKMVADMLQSFNKIVAAVEKMANSASEVAAATQEQAATTEEITASVQEVSDLIGHTATEAENVVVEIDKSTEALHGIANTVRDLKKGDSESAENRKLAAA
jgi:methyl-accepting chemotaxis protein